MSENRLNKWSKDQTAKENALKKGVEKPFVYSWNERKPEWEREPVHESEEDINKFIETQKRREDKAKKWANVDAKKFYNPKGGKRKSRKGKSKKSRKGKSKKSRKGKSRKGKSKKSRNNRRK